MYSSMFYIFYVLLHALHIAACIVFIHRYVEEHTQSNTYTAIHSATHTHTSHFNIIPEDIYTPDIKMVLHPFKEKKKNTKQQNFKI